MIKVLYTRKLFFEKYSIKIIIRTESSIENRFFKWDLSRQNYPKNELDDTKIWLDDNIGSLNYKMRDYYVSRKTKDFFLSGDIPDSSNVGTIWDQMIYVNDDHQKDLIIGYFGDRVIEITQPFDKEHKDKLEVRNVTVVRSTLLYNKYQYVVYFKYDREKEVKKWLKTFFEDETGHLLYLNDYSPRVYLRDDNHLTTIKLMWQDKIDHIKTVQLLKNG